MEKRLSGTHDCVSGVSINNAAPHVTAQLYEAERLTELSPSATYS